MKKALTENTTVTVQETYRAMSEINYGEREANFKFACWNAVLSMRMRLHLNGRYARVMAQFVERPLPERSELLLALGSKDGIKLPAGMMGSHIKALYAIEQLDNAGLLDSHAGDTLVEQQAWRTRMVALIPGMGSKLVSWALFIFRPFNCKLLTIDCHHCGRMGVEQATLGGSSKRQQVAYHAQEARMLAECMGLYPEYPPVVVAAMLWQNYRLAKGASNENGYESHREISCRWY